MTDARSSPDDHSPTPALDQFWRCVHGCIGVAMGPPAIMHPPRCAHGEMEQTTADGFTNVSEGSDV